MSRFPRPARTWADLLRRATEGQVVDEKAPSAGAKSLCIPFDQDRFGKLEPGTKCIGCGADAKRWTMFGRSESACATSRKPD